MTSATNINMDEYPKHNIEQKKQIIEECCSTIPFN